MSHENINKDNKQPPSIIKDDEIDLVALMLHIWNGRKIILKTVAVFIVLGLLIALTSPEKYKSQVKLIPQIGAGSSGLGSLGGLASQFGFGGLGGANVAAESGAIPPDYYPEIVSSLPFLQALLEEKVYFEEIKEEITLFDYFNDYQAGFSFGSFLRRYTIGLPHTIIDLFKSDPEKVVVEDVTGRRQTIRLSEEEWEVVEKLEELITLEVGTETGMVTITTEMPQDYLAADIADIVSEKLSEFILAYKTDKSREDLRFVEERYSEAKKRFQESQEELAKFRDATRGRLTALAQTQEERLQSEYDLAFNVYNSLASQLEEARIKLQEDTPIVQVINPAAIPNERSSPRRSMIMIISVILGGFLGVVVLFGKMVWTNIKEKVKEYN
ncbi:GNVR domain-containing protein [Marinilabiliaceae bacterium ANBcel2]|nr:GNVR domain-containing protein [Marinilabiliaceae bacterium ANBcel2]